MKTKQKYLAIAIAFFSAFLLVGSMKGRVYAEGENTTQQFYSYGEDGIVSGSKEFIIKADPGENFDIIITFSGTGTANETLSFTYDLVTDDQMVANVVKSDDRSGLLNETVKKGEVQTRSFSVAALDGDIVITATGSGKVENIKAVKQAAKTAGEKVTVYTVGDSLVQTYSERYAPQTGWGQTLYLYFGDNVNFVNRALGGRSTGNYLRQGRLNQVLCEIAPGDCVLIEFGHNDGNSGNADRYVNPLNFSDYLENVYIKAIRDRGGIPILVTLCNPNRYVPATGEFSPQYADYVKAMIKSAKATDTMLIDLNAITVQKFTELNKELGSGITKQIIYNHAIAGAYEGDYAKGVKDDTHLQYYGAKLVAGYIAEELQKLNIAGVSEHYKALEAKQLDKAPSGLSKKIYEGFLSRITWTPCKDADYYKVLVAEVVEKPVEGVEAEPVYELAGEFMIAGYTTVCDFAYTAAEEGKNYAYKVVAINAAGESPESEIYSFGLLKEAEDEVLDTTTDKQDVADDADNGPKPIVIVAVVAVVVVVGNIVIFAVKSKRNKA